MQLDYKGDKGFRLLNLYERLNKDETVSKETLANDFGVSQKTIQRDIDDLRAYLAETQFDEYGTAIKYSRTKGGYYPVRQEREWFTNQGGNFISYMIRNKVLQYIRAITAKNTADTQPTIHSKGNRNENHNGPFRS